MHQRGFLLAIRGSTVMFNLLILDAMNGYLPDGK